MNEQDIAQFLESHLKPKPLTKEIKLEDSGLGDLDWDWTLFPNPASQSIRIHGHANRQGIFTIWSATGQPVLTHLDAGSDIKLDLSGLPAGMYILQWKGDQGQHQQRFQIVR